ncbi:hypothetical protein AB2B38_008205 [Balneola sp. MJW-20]|uniref:hypothetical protein n=1 Tax=Gracilimonas aurantiaca TaxID=3234185 RepID=UPI003466E087
MHLNKIFEELKRRNVIKVATAYAVTGWLIIQVVTAVEEPLNLPGWFDTAIIVLVLIGLPVALIIAWAFELTPDGLVKTEEVSPDQSKTGNTGKRINKLIITSLSLLIVFLLVERVFFASGGNIEDAEKTPALQISDKSIAVLPFDDFNAGGEQEYFADGLTEEILNSLAKTPDLLVASRTSSFQYKDRNIDIMRIADTLGVAHILEGSVRESTDKYRITAQLIRASDGFHLWSENYDRPKTDIIDIQEDIAFQIATALETAMDPEALKDMLAVGTTSIEAYRLYLEGTSLLYGLKQAQAYQRFEEARKLDPSFAAAHYQSANVILGDLSLTTMNTQVLDHTYEEKLRMIDDRMSAAIAKAGEVEKLLYLSTQAYTNLEIRRSLDYLLEYYEKRPSDFGSAYNIIDRMTFLGEYDQAREFNKRIQKNALINNVNVGQFVAFYFWADDEENADPFMQQMLDQFPYSELLSYQSHRMMLWRGEFERARETRNLIRGLEIQEESMALTELRQACAEGRDEEAYRIYEDRITGNDVAVEWIALKTLSMDEEAEALIRPIYDSGQLLSLVTWLYYRYFDYTRFPELLRILESEQHKRGPIIQIPFRCGR